MICQQLHFVSRWGRGLVGGRLVSLGWAALAGPRPSRFAGPRFFFLGLAAPPGFGLFRLRRFFPGSLTLFGGPLILGGLIFLGRGGRLFRFNLVFGSHLFGGGLFGSVLRSRGLQRGSVLGGWFPASLLGSVLRGRGLQRGNILGRSTLQTSIEQAGLGIFFRAHVQFFVCHVQTSFFMELKKPSPSARPAEKYSPFPFEF